jgi:hypothetical protein
VASEAFRGPNQVFSGGGGLRSATSAGGGPAGHLAGAAVTQVGGFRAATGVGEGQAQRRALALFDFLSTIVTNENRLSGQGNPPGRIE